MKQNPYCAFNNAYEISNNWKTHFALNLNTNTLISPCKFSNLQAFQGKLISGSAVWRDCCVALADSGGALIPLIKSVHACHYGSFGGRSDGGFFSIGSQTDSYIYNMSLKGSNLEWSINHCWHLLLWSTFRFCSFSTRSSRPLRFLSKILHAILRMLW